MPETDDYEDRPAESILGKADGKPRLLAEQCATCVYRPGNIMGLRRGRLKDLTEGALQGTGLVCHDTLSYGTYPDFGAAMCRGFYDKFGPANNFTRVMERLGGFTEVSPPGDNDG